MRSKSEADSLIEWIDQYLEPREDALCDGNANSYDEYRAACGFNARCALVHCVEYTISHCLHFVSILTYPEGLSLFLNSWVSLTVSQPLHNFVFINMLCQAPAGLLQFQEPYHR